ncbi:hypothetical protein PAPYR_2491 [Paratrimastix pyriformis]|uniref:Uncharacterized protein n=1 Tax=Paratrimastix pyriformis TaxID=342808 RepID=A0ABQ8UPE5_9EUKA|nr:hypothetical protein PAPYR_2491 [Paratrimastix pyriformis]
MARFSWTRPNVPSRPVRLTSSIASLMTEIIMITGVIWTTVILAKRGSITFGFTILGLDLLFASVLMMLPEIFSPRALLMSMPSVRSWLGKGIIMTFIGTLALAFSAWPTTTAGSIAIVVGAAFIALHPLVDFTPTPLLLSSEDEFAQKMPSANVSLTTTVAPYPAPAPPSSSPTAAV